MSFLEAACRQARERVKRGYYDLPDSDPRFGKHTGLVQALVDKVSLVCEIKQRSPTAGDIRIIDDPVDFARKMVAGGADAISILTDPDNFLGSMNFLLEVSRAVEKPTLMKDFVVSWEQIDAARRAGASAVLLIYPVFERGYSDLSLDDALSYAHRLGLDVLLEVYDPEDLGGALSTRADLVGVNSRNLDTLDVSLERAREMVEAIDECERARIVVESGIRCAEDIKKFLDLGVNKFLVGTAIMSSGDIASRIRELKGARRDG